MLPETYWFGECGHLTVLNAGEAERDVINDATVSGRHEILSAQCFSLHGPLGGALAHLWRKRQCCGRQSVFRAGRAGRSSFTEVSVIATLNELCGMSKNASLRKRSKVWRRSAFPWAARAGWCA